MPVGTNRPRRFPILLLLGIMMSAVVARGFLHQSATARRSSQLYSLVANEELEEAKRGWFSRFRRKQLALSSSSSSSCNETTSVHLQLQSTHGADSAVDNKTENEQKEREDKNNSQEMGKSNNTKTVQVLTFQDVKSRTVYKALNTGKKKFQAFLEYHNVKSSLQDMEHFTVNMQDDVASRQVRSEWRELWKQERLISERTEVLALYPSEKEETKSNVKRGGFSDHLQLYIERLLAILRDERELSESNTLVDWLSEHYGKDETQRLIATHFHAMPEKQQLSELKLFLEWFRSEFPYYYDRCSHCGSSVKEDTAAQDDQNEKDEDETSADLHGNAPVVEGIDDTAIEEDEDSEDQSFLGYIYPDAKELLGKANRTELYKCHKCHGFTRFPRFNSATHVLDSRRGRCGEYSVLLFEFLRALGHQARWVVDWADHVWAGKE